MEEANDGGEAGVKESSALMTKASAEGGGDDADGAPPVAGEGGEGGEGGASSELTATGGNWRQSWFSKQKAALEEAAKEGRIAYVEVRAVAMRFKALLHALPVPASASPMPKSLMPPSRGDEGGEEGDKGAADADDADGGEGGASSSSTAMVAGMEGAPPMEPTRADEEFVISLYPLGVDRERAYALAEATGRAPVAVRQGKEEQQRELVARERAETREREKREAAVAKAEARAKAAEAKAEESAQRKAQREEVMMRNRNAREETRTREAVTNLLNAMITRLETEEKRSKKEGQAKVAREARQAQQKERKKEHDAKRDRDEEKRVRQMKKLKALGDRKLVDMALSTVATVTVGNAPACGGVWVSVRLTPSPSGVAAAASSEEGTLDALAALRRVKSGLSSREVAPVSVSGGFSALLSEYDPTKEKEEKFSKMHRWHMMLEGVELTVQAALGHKYTVRSSIGCGKWARIPWVAMHEPQQTTQSGLFLQYLMRTDASGVYLCLGQGTAKLRAAAGPVAANTHMARMGAYARERCIKLLGTERAARFDLTGQAELRAPKGHGAPYEKAVLVCKLYERQRVPSEAEMMDDLRVLTAVYAQILTEPMYAELTKQLNENTLNAAAHAAQMQQQQQQQQQQMQQQVVVAPGGPAAAAKAKAAAAPKAAAQAVVAGGVPGGVLGGVPGVGVAGRPILSAPPPGLHPIAHQTHAHAIYAPSQAHVASAAHAAHAHAAHAAQAHAAQAHAAAQRAASGGAPPGPRHALGSAPGLHAIPVLTSAALSVAERVGGVSVPGTVLVSAGALGAGSVSVVGGGHQGR